ncbi:MAG TPA: acyl-ACP thioesterase domain-containing protein [Syntrophomonadaceae bacterium]|nr:acyl-ACP thioesterase domain-containing protein [Syntrophomonadaceae bacterium]
MPGFQKEYEIRYFQIDQSKEATPVSILHFLEDIAIFHSQAVGLGIDRLLEKRTGWILNRWVLRMEKYPRLGDKISIKTWTSRFERFYARREFMIDDPQGNPLGRASSLWIYLNVDKKRPLRIPEQFEQAYGVIEKMVMDDSYRDLPDMTDPETGMSFRVRRSDIDTNGHVNNARYVEWMIEGINGDLIQDYQLSELEVVYKKETVYGTNVYSEYQMINKAHPEYLHRILDKTEDRELALGRTVWQKR